MVATAVTAAVTAAAAVGCAIGCRGGAGAAVSKEVNCFFARGVLYGTVMISAKKEC